MKNALLVPGVFFLSLLSAVVIFAFFGGIALRYEMAVPFASESAGLLLLCMAQKACYVLPFAVMMAIIGVYTFLMRHPAKLSVALTLFLVCLIFTVTVIAPICYAQFSVIEKAIAAYKTTAPIDKALAAFTSKPLFLALLQQGSGSLFSDVYTAYTLYFTTYLLFTGALFFCVSSFWFACIITRWNLFNLLFLLLLSGCLLLVYPYMQLEGFRTTLFNLHITNSENSIYGIPLVLCVVAVVFHSIGVLKILLIYSNCDRTWLLPYICVFFQKDRCTASVFVKPEISGNRNLIYTNYAKLTGFRRIDRICRHLRYLRSKYRTEVFRHITSLLKGCIYYAFFVCYYLYHLYRNSIAIADGLSTLQRL